MEANDTTHLCNGFFLQIIKSTGVSGLAVLQVFVSLLLLMRIKQRFAVL
jgi:hypothetical protein